MDQRRRDELYGQLSTVADCCRRLIDHLLDELARRDGDLRELRKEFEVEKLKWRASMRNRPRIS